MQARCYQMLMQNLITRFILNILLLVSYINFYSVFLVPCANLMFNACQSEDTSHGTAGPSNNQDSTKPDKVNFAKITLLFMCVRVCFFLSFFSVSFHSCWNTSSKCQLLAQSIVNSSYRPTTRLSFNCVAILLQSLIKAISIHQKTYL